jgi:signal transduction histidine kinase
MGSRGGFLIRKLLGPTVGALLAAVGATLGATLGFALGLPSVAVVILAACGALLAALPGAGLSLVMPTPPSLAQQVVDGLPKGQPVPDTPSLEPLRALQTRLDAHTVVEARLREEVADAQRRAITAEAKAYGEQQRATEARKVRTAFLTRMSHELRTPLNAVIGYAEMVAEELDDDALVADLTRIRRAGLHLKGLVTTVLDLTQLESGRYEVRPESVDLSSMVREVLEGARNEAEMQQNTLQLEAPERAEATVDPRMVQSILFNLVHNAVKYTARGRVTVTVTVDDEVHISVHDTGIGMTKQQLEQAFEPFTQGDGTTTRRYDGSGLGLAICRGFAEAMGGRMAVQSVIQEGATIDVFLPLEVEAHVPDDEDLDEPTMLLR